jgi:hypothetical protein
MRLRLRITLLSILGVIALAAAPTVFARGGNYVVDGGTRFEREQVVKALDVSSFDWSIVPAQITVHIARGIDSEATRGNIWLDADLLRSGTFSWGVVQHEYAHQVDFFLLSDVQRATLVNVLHAEAWCWDDVAGLAHSAYGCERFASTLAWAYWTSPQNCMRPQSAGDESDAMAAAAFRALLKRMLGANVRQR